MLDAIRKRKENFLSIFIILAVVIVMGFFGVSKFSGEDSAKSGVAAYVNGEAITSQEFRQELEYTMMRYQSMLGAQYDEKLLNALQIPQRTLDQLIQFKLLAQQAKSLGVLVSDKELADFIRGLPYYQKEGKFDFENYSKIPNRGQEEKKKREQLLTHRFQSYLSDRIRLTPFELKTAYWLKNAKAEIEFAKINFNTLAPVKKPTENEISGFLSKSAEVVKQYYETHKSEFTEKAEVELKQIRVGTAFQADAKVKQDAKKKIEEIAKEVTVQNFADLAKSKSDDEHAKKGGLVGWVKRGTLDKNLEQVIDKLEVGKLSNPIETPFGYFILLVNAKKPESVIPFDTIKSKTAEKILVENSRKSWEESKKKEWETTLSQGKTIEPELKKLKIEFKKTGSFAPSQGQIPNLGQADAIVDTLYELSKDKNPFAKKLLYFQENYYFIKLVSFESPKMADFEKAADEIDKSSSSPLQGELLTKWVEGLQKNAKIESEMKSKKQGSKQPGAPDEAEEV